MPLRPLEWQDGHLPIGDHALIGDGHGCALVGRDASIVWMCVPRFDDPPVFCGLLDAVHGGSFRLFAEVLEAEQRYLDDTAVVVTTVRTPTGVCEVTDAFLLHPGARLDVEPTPGVGELLRRVRVLSGSVLLDLAVEPRGGAVTTPYADGLALRAARFPGLDLHLSVHPAPDARAPWRLEAGREVDVVLRWGAGSGRRRRPDHGDLLAETAAAWRRWTGQVAYDGLQRPLVRRSAITLKLLDHLPNGAIIAAPTSSLPEAIGGVRNWDYRYTWVRDAAFTVHALRRVGLHQESERFLGWVLDAIERDGVPRVMYDVDGHRVPAEQTDPELSGYRHSAPVRWANSAADQVQHDVYGEVLDCAYQWVRGGGRLDPPLAATLARLADVAMAKAGQPDHGIWEVRSSGRPFTYSVAMCQVALDRAAIMSRTAGLGGDADKWAVKAAELRDRILTEAWDPALGSLTEQLGPGGGLDASLLALPLRRVLPADHPRMVATARAVAERLDAGHGLLYRYLPDKSPDGLPGHEGAFLLCSFWLVDNLAGQGRLDEATELYESLCARAGVLGLLPEQIEPGDGSFLGNYPQAFSHIGVIASGVNLARLAARGLPHA